MSLAQLLFGPNFPETFEYIGSNGSRDVNRITVPTFAREGDLAILCDNIQESNVEKDPFDAPSGWTLINKVRGSDSKPKRDKMMGGITCYKILTQADVGSTVYSVDKDKDDQLMLVAIFRPSEFVAISTYINDAKGQAMLGRPDPQNLNLVGLTNLPAIAFFVMMIKDDGGGDVDLSGAPEGFESIKVYKHKPNEVKIALFYKIYSVYDVPDNSWAYMYDESEQVFQSFYLTFIA